MVRPYRWLAEYYDLLFAEMREPLDRAREEILADILTKVETACDLACGTGSTAIKFARRGIRTYAVDLSPQMCAITRAKASRKDPIKVIRGDMRSFQVPERVDLVVCEFDALNHIPNAGDFPEVLRSVAHALKPRGYFFFDVNNAAGFERYWTGNFFMEKKDVAVLMRNGHSEACTRAWTDIDWFIREGRLWRRHSERVEEVCWTEKEIRAALRDAGFSTVRSFDAAKYFPDEPRVSHGCRTIYLARRSRT